MSGPTPGHAPPDPPAPPPELALDGPPPLEAEVELEEATIEDELEEAPPVPSTWMSSMPKTALHAPERTITPAARSSRCPRIRTFPPRGSFRDPAERRSRPRAH